MTETKLPVILRLDDVGASSKRYEIYSSLQRRIGPLGIPANWLFLKYLPGLRAWGPYSELSAERWCQIFALLEQNNARITLGVTAAWVEDEKRLVPYPEKFPEAAAVLKDASARGIIEIANHGLTHCTVVGNAFKPKLFSGNREFHREFNAKISLDVQYEHLRESQRTLNDYFETDVVTFVPPGRQFSVATLSLARDVGLSYIAYNVRNEGVVFPIEQVISFLCHISDDPTTDKESLVTLESLESMLYQSVTSRGHRMVSFHDREIVLGGIRWLGNVLTQNNGSEFVFARDMGDRFPSDGLFMRK